MWGTTKPHLSGVAEAKELGPPGQSKHVQTTSKHETVKPQKVNTKTKQFRNVLLHLLQLEW